MTQSPYEQRWNSPDPVHAHQFYAPVLLGLLPKPSHQNGAPLKVLDLGCGNGSLTNLIAQQGFDVTGIEESAAGVKQASQAFPNCEFRQYSVYSPPLVNFLARLIL